MRMRTRAAASSERGAVLVMVAVWLPLLALFVMFAVDSAHWFDYSRNLQMRADAAARAGGNQIGGTCIGSSPSAGALARIGQITQLYSGADQASSDLYPYTGIGGPYGSGFPGSAVAPDNPNFPNLKLGHLDKYHVLLNSPRYWQTGDTSQSQSFTMPGSGGGNFCTTVDEDGKTGPIVDIRVTQDNLPLFLPFVSWRPTISAHARVALLQANAEGLVRAIAVRDPTPGCVYVKIRNANTDALYKTIQLPLDPTGDPVNPAATLWDNDSHNPADDVDMSQGPFYVQVLASDTDCNTAPSGITYDSWTDGSGIPQYTGLEFINTYGSALPGPGGKPLISTSGMGDGTGGVFLTGCVPDQYFSGAACTVGVTANVAFAVPFTANSCAASGASQIVKATDVSTNTTISLARLCTQVNGKQDNVTQLAVTSTAGFSPSGSIDVGSSSYAYTAKDATHFTLAAPASFANNDVVTQTGDNRWTAGSGGFGINAESGRHPIQINWEQQAGSTPLGSCSATGGNPCKGNFGIQQQTFAACGNCDPPDASGPVVAMRVRFKGDSAGSAGRNSFSNGDDPNLVFEVVTQAIRYDTPGTRDHLLRVSVQTDKATGLLNCGAGTGAAAAIQAIKFGCPFYTDTTNCKDINYCAPYKIYPVTPHVNGLCDPLSRQEGSTYADCVATNSVSGNKAVIVNAVADRVVASNGDCSANHWQDYVNDPTGHPIQGDTDPRAFTLVITAPADLSQNSLTVPIRNFATFYVTGWDEAHGAANCLNSKLVGGTFGNDPFLCNAPSDSNCVSTTGSKQDGSYSVWGHWIFYVDASASAIGSNPKYCQPSQFGVCTPVLTR
jgi:hypothetical protein